MRHLKVIIGVIVVSVIVLVLMSVIVGSADKSDSKRTAGFFGNWIFMSALVIVAGASYLGFIYVAKNKT